MTSRIPKFQRFASLLFIVIFSAFLNHHAEGDSGEESAEAQNEALSFKSDKRRLRFHTLIQEEEKYLHDIDEETGVAKSYDTVRKHTIEEELRDFFSLLRPDTVGTVDGLELESKLQETLNNFSGIRAQCFNVLASLEYLMSVLLDRNFEVDQDHFNIDAQAVSHNAAMSLKNDVLLNEYNEVAGMEILFQYAAKRYRLVKSYMNIVVHTVLFQPHCYNNELRLVILKVFVKELKDLDTEYDKMQFFIVWRNTYTVGEAFRLTEHAGALVSFMHQSLRPLFELQTDGILKTIMKKRQALQQNRRGQNTEYREIGHDWRRENDDGGFLDFFNLYRSTFKEWICDHGLIRGVIKMFAHKYDSLVDLGAGGGHYVEYLRTGFGNIAAFDASPIVEENLIRSNVPVKVGDLASDRFYFENFVDNDTADSTAEPDSSTTETNAPSLNENTQLLSVEVFEKSIEDNDTDKSENHAVTVSEDGDMTEDSSGAQKARVQRLVTSGKQYEIVLCIEVAEHLAISEERTFMKNLYLLTKNILIISWSNDRVNEHHRNPKSKDEVVKFISEFEIDDCADGETGGMSTMSTSAAGTTTQISNPKELGLKKICPELGGKKRFRLLEKESEMLKDYATVSWIKENVLVFVKE